MGFGIHGCIDKGIDVKEKRFDGNMVAEMSKPC